MQFVTSQGIKLKIAQCGSYNFHFIFIVTNNSQRIFSVFPHFLSDRKSGRVRSENTFFVSQMSHFHNIWMTITITVLEAYINQ